MPRALLARLLLLAALGAPPAAAQLVVQIDAAQPDAPAPWTSPEDDPLQASVGTVFSIQGSGFAGLSGKSKPKVFLVDPAKPKQKFGLKVSSFSDTEIVAELKRARPVLLDLVVAAKGKGLVPAVAEGAVLGVLPDFVAAEPAAPGDTVTLVAVTGFGTAKGKLRVNGKPVKVQSWSPLELSFKAPAKLHDGLFTLTVANRLGTGVSDQGLYGFAVDGSGLDVGGPDRYSVRAASKLLKAGTGLFDLLGLVQDGEPPTLLVSAVLQQSDAATGKPFITHSVRVPLDLESAVFPFAVVADPDGLLQHSETAPGNLFPTASWTTEEQGDDYVVVLHSFKPNELTGGMQLHLTFSGKLHRVLGSSGKPVLPFTQGDCKITIVPDGD